MRNTSRFKRPYTLRVSKGGSVSAVYPYRTLIIPHYMVDFVYDALVAQAGRVGATDPLKAEWLRAVARQLK